MENNKSWLIALTTLVILIVLGGFGLFISQTLQMNNLRQEMGFAITELSSQIGGLKTSQIVEQSSGLNAVNSNSSSATAGSQIVTSVPSPSIPTPTPVATSISYSNSSYGFSLQLPLAWKGYVTKLDTRADGVYMYFGLTKDESLFAIGIYTKAQWDKVKNDALTSRLYIGENGQYVFIGQAAQDVSPGLSARYQEVGQILTTFKSIK